MAKALHGSSRQAWAFMWDNWLWLCKLSLVPLLVLFASIWLKARFLPVDGVTNGLIGLVAFLISCWLFTLIVRFTRSHKATWLVQGGENIRAIVMTILYATGIFILVLLVGLIASTLTFLTSSALLDYAESHKRVGALWLLSITFDLFQLGLQCWLLLRLLVGLPAVSLGGLPHVFHGFWPLASGESWGLPLRLFLPWLVATVLTAAILYPALSGLAILALIPGLDGSGRPIELLLMAESSGWLQYAAAALIVVLVPLFWFFTLLLTTAYHRFSQR